MTMSRDGSLGSHPSLAAPSSRSVALAFVVAGVLCGGGGCKEDRVRHRPHVAFDPMRYDAGPAPDDDAPLPALLVFGVTPFYSPERQRPMLGRLEAYLTEATGIPTEARVAETYEACVDALANGELDVAQLSPYAFVRARARIPDLVPIATAIAQGSQTYASYLVVRRDSPIAAVEQTQGARLGLVDPFSTSGYLYPAAWLRARGLDAERDFRVSWLGSHDRTLAALLAREVDVAAVSSDTLVNARALGPAGPVRIIAKPGRIPYDAVVARGGLSPLVLYRVRRAFLTLTIHRERAREVLEDYNLINAFMPIPEGHYDEVDRIARLALDRDDAGSNAAPASAP